MTKTSKKGQWTASKVRQIPKSSTNRGTRTVSQGQPKTKDLHKGAPDSVQGQTKAKVLQTRGNGQCPEVSQRQKSSVRGTWRINIDYCLSGTSWQNHLSSDQNNNKINTPNQYHFFTYPLSPTISMPHRQCQRMQDHTDNKKKLSLDYSLKLSTLLDPNKRSIPCGRSKWIQSWYPADAIIAPPVPFKCDNISMPTHVAQRVLCQRKRATRKRSSKPSATDTTLRYC